MAFSQSQSIFLVFCLLLLATNSSAQPFRCSPGATCNALIDYILPNTTTLAAIKTLFGVKNHRSILGANNFPPSTSQNETFQSGTTIRIPFPCRCSNGTGISNNRPLYTVVPNDGLYHIAAEVFAGLVTFQRIQEVNNISDANLIEVGQELLIPLPCSCDDVDGSRAVHYGHVVGAGNTVEGIAQNYNITPDLLLRVNGLATANDLMAGVVLDVPLRACTSTIRNESLDYPFLVPNGTYAYTATNCISCSCDATNNWTLQCRSSGLNSSRWQSCPSTTCEGSGLSIGNSTSSSNCNRTTCAYAGYSNQTIFTSLALDSTCPGSDNSVARLVGWQNWRWNLVIVATHLLLFCLY